MKRETNSWRYPLLMAASLFALAYVAAFANYRIHPGIRGLTLMPYGRSWIVALDRHRLQRLRPVWALMPSAARRVSPRDGA